MQRFVALLSATAIFISSFVWSGAQTNLFTRDPPLYKWPDPPSPLTPKMTSLHIEPTSPGNNSVAIYIGDSKIYLDTTGFKPTRTYLLKVKDSYRTVSAVPAPVLCEASVVNEALHLLTTHSIAQRLREPASTPLYVRLFLTVRHRFTAHRTLAQRLAVFPVSWRALNEDTSYR